MCEKIVPMVVANLKTEPDRRPRNAIGASEKAGWTLQQARNQPARHALDLPPRFIGSRRHCRERLGGVESNRSTAGLLRYLSSS